VATRVVIVGPGRVGSAFGRRLCDSGFDVQGFIGRDRVRSTAAVAFAGRGAELEPADHAAADVVVFAVGDADLVDAVEAMLAAARPRAGSLWLHTSGCHDLGVFDRAAALGVLRGSLHPVAPFADAASGLRAMAGCPAVIAGDAAAISLLEGLVEGLGMRCLHDDGGDRALYHAACALAANGLVVLRGLVDEVFAAAGGLNAADARIAADALMTAALETTAADGAAAALSGPVQRGDSSTVERHLDVLAAGAPHAVGAYCALMHGALRLAQQRGLSPAAVAAVRRALGGEDVS